MTKQGEGKKPSERIDEIHFGIVMERTDPANAGNVYLDPKPTTMIRAILQYLDEQAEKP